MPNPVLVHPTLSAYLKIDLCHIVPIDELSKLLVIVLQAAPLPSLTSFTDASENWLATRLFQCIALLRMQLPVEGRLLDKLHHVITSHK